MKLRMVLLSASILGCVLLALASSKISDESYQLVRRLVSYKNQEIDNLKDLAQYTLDCSNVSDTEFKTKNCSTRITALQEADRNLQVKHDVLGQEIANHIRQHKDEEWIFLGLMVDDKEFSNLAHSPNRVF
jgi:hypothetical protein